MEKMNKIGQIDKIITSIPVMILLFVILAIFLFLSFSVKTLNQPQVPEVSISSAGNENLLLKTANFGENNVLQKLSVFDLIVKAERKEIGRSEIEKALKEISKNGKCAILVKAHYDKTLTGSDFVYTDYAWYVKNGETLSSSYGPEFEKKLLFDYRARKLLASQPYYINGIDGSAGHSAYIASYYGECLT